jgi:hypothetical protein
MAEMHKIRRYIEVKFQKEGIHSYPQAGTDPALADVSFLAHPHRHIFHFYVRIAVLHNDRDVEFIQFKRWLESLYKTAFELSGMSCEMIAEGLIYDINDKYPDRSIIVKVYEDDENGAILEYKV